MKKTQPLFAPTADRQAFDMAPAGVLLLLAKMVYGPQDDPEWTGRPKAEAMILAILAAARAGGYTQTDILHTMLVRDEYFKRLELMARAACAAAGPDRIAALFGPMQRGEE